MITYVTFSDKPLTATHSTLALAGNTDESMDLNQLLVLMYKTWTTEVFQEALTLKADPLIVIPE